MNNKVQLITYVDRLCGGGIAQLRALLAGPLSGVFGGVHLLPFYSPIDGADAGFDPVDHTQVDPRLGDWHDVHALAGDVEVMADVIVNHMSSASPQFQSYLAHGDASPHAGLFLTFDKVFPQGAREQDLLAIYRPRPGLPFTGFTLADGQRRILWTTFTPQQVDIDVHHPQGQAYLQGILRTLASAGVRSIRLDAVGYAIKRPGGSCFMMPQTFDFIDAFAAQAKSLGLQVLVEIHGHYRMQQRIAARVDWVYDFALPPLVLHALYTTQATALRHWAAIRPTNALTVLDTHDGIGIVDIGPDASAREACPGLLPPEALDLLVQTIHQRSGGQSRQATGTAASNLDIYQVNCTFYDALGRDDRAYLIARAIQFFLPGIPQVYYVGLLAGHNDMDLLARSKVGRDINRHYYQLDEVRRELERPVVQDLLRLIALRNTHPAFGGQFSLLPGSEEELGMRWVHGEHQLSLNVNLRTLDCSIDMLSSTGSQVHPLQTAQPLDCAPPTPVR